MLKKLFTKFIKFKYNEEGVISIEMAAILPILLSLGLLSYDAGGLYKSITRGNNALYAVGDVISSLDSNTTCYMTSVIGTGALDAYREGHWAQKTDARWWGARWRLGEKDFQFRVQGIKVQKVGDLGVDPNDLKAEVLWTVHKRQETVFQIPSSIPGALIDIPKEYQISEEFYIFVDGINRARAPLGFLEVFGDYEITSQNYFVPRYRPEIRMEGGWRGSNCQGN